MACRLYLISPSAFESEAFAENLEQALSGGDVAAFQLRIKNFPRNTDEKSVRTLFQKIKSATKVLLPICRAKNVAFLINDYPEIAMEVGADGVHIGNDPELPEGFTTDLRKKNGKNFTIGVSCYDSRHLAMVAAEQGADYVSFGAFFPTKTKISPGKPKPEILEWWSKYTTVPCTAIGGINPENCGGLVKAGADFIAVVSYVWEHPKGPKVAVKEINSAIAKSLVNC